MVETAQLVCVQFFPDLVKLGVLVELTILKSLSGFAVKNLHCPFCEEHEGVGMAVGGFVSDEAGETGVARTKQWELAWALELEAEWEVEGGSECGRLQTATEKGVVMGSPVQVE